MDAFGETMAGTNRAFAWDIGTAQSVRRRPVGPYHHAFAQYKAYAQWPGSDDPGGHRTRLSGCGDRVGSFLPEKA